jgi:hypothetical protein
MKRKIATVFLAAAFLGCGGAVYGHHSFAAYFRTDETTSIKGVVTEFWFRNPHARVYLDVTTDGGEVEKWMVETNSPNSLIRSGWSKETITPGMTLVIAGGPSRDGSKTIGAQSIATAEGVALWP